MAAPGAPESEVDITSLLQPRQGYLWKLGGGQEKGSKWNRRWCAHTHLMSSSLPALVLSAARSRRFVLRDNVLMYFSTPKDFTGARRHA
tara:strand:- start:498 stop:764 length:267 start_codon:yes stop_codon:yes gene_type:complete